MTKKDNKTETPINEEVKNEEVAQEATSEQSTAENMAEESTDESAKLAEEVAIWQDKYVRLSAEFDNFRRRTLKEKMELIDTAGADTIKSILVILDDMERAVEANKKSEDIEAVRTGSELIHKKLSDILKSKGVSEIEAMGGELDTDLHEAIAKFPVEEEAKKGRIIDVVEKGYKLKDRVIRFSKVVIGE